MSYTGKSTTGKFLRGDETWQALATSDVTGLDTALAGKAAMSSAPTAKGLATLVGGTATVLTALVTANSLIFLAHQTLGGALGLLYISARTAGVSFVITSLNALDTSTVAWMLLEP